MAGILRNPMAQVIAGGNPMAFESFEVTQTRTKKGDTAHVKAALDNVDLNFWLTTTPIPVQIIMNGATLFNGNADHSDYDFAGGDFSFSCRDAAAATMDSQSSEKFLNQNAANIVQTIAGRHGIPVVMDTPPDDAGKMLSTDFDSISNRSSEWSVINALADHYGMVAYLTGGTLYFKNYNETLATYQLTYSPPTPAQMASGNFIKLKASRNHILGRPVTVNVRSHNHRSKTVNSATATSATGTGDPLIYNITRPQLSTSQVNTIAQSKLAEIQSHELTIDELELPGDETINARMTFTLSGTNSPFDQNYDANSITHKFGFKDGYSTSIHVKNKKGSK